MDVLIGLFSVIFVQFGGMGEQMLLFLCGINFLYMLLLVDGVWVGMVSVGLVVFEQILVEQIEWIEVVCGLCLSLYGVDVIGGVIQVFICYGYVDGGIVLLFSLIIGSCGIVGGQVGLFGGDCYVWYNFSLGGQYICGINVCCDGVGMVFVGCFVNELDKDVFCNYNVLVNVGYCWDDGIELVGIWLCSCNYVEFDGVFYGNQVFNVQQVVGMCFMFWLLLFWQLIFGVGQNLDKVIMYNDGVYLCYFDLCCNQVLWQNDFSLVDNQLFMLGIDYQQEYLFSDIGYFVSIC